MRKEFALPEGLIVFESLDDLLSSIDEYVSYLEDSIRRYGDRLSLLLRPENVESTVSTPRVVQTASPSSSSTFWKRKEKPQQQQQLQLQKSQLDENRLWLTFKLKEYTLRVANSSLPPSSAEQAALFRIIEILRGKVHTLKSARDLISSLPSQGLRMDASNRIFVVFSEGEPKQLITTKESYSLEKKFHYRGDFRISMMK